MATLRIHGKLLKEAKVQHPGKYNHRQPTKEFILRIYQDGWILYRTYGARWKMLVRAINPETFIMLFDEIVSNTELLEEYLESRR